ncbi:MAG: MFS transporter [Aestuariivita sp.]|uniref:MFS transporter n=1 Tax=Aestuariivita sp. TaxID=1872407 RepID=UPI003BAED8B0
MVSRTPFGLICLIWFAGLGAAAQYGKISVIYDQLPAVYPQAGPALGFIVSLVGFVGIVFGVVAGLLVARVGYRRALIWALWGGALLSLGQAVLPPLPVLLALRGLEGVSHLAIVVAAPTLIAHLSAPRHVGLTMTLWSTFFGVAYTVLVWGGLPLVMGFGLSSLFIAHALWMAALALILGRALRGLPLRRSVEPMSLSTVLRDHKAIYRSASISAPAMGWLFYTFCFLAILTLIPPYLPDGVRAAVLGAMPLVSIAVSMTLGVVLLRYMSAVVEILLGFGLTVACLVWLLLDPGLPLACLALAAALGLIQGASFAAVPQLNARADTQAQANGAMAQMGNVGNTLGTPILAAVLAVAGYGGMIGLAIFVFALGGATHIWLAMRRRS